MSSNQDVNTDLKSLLEDCKQGKRYSQKLLYQQYYGYAMSICLRYGHGYENAVEIVNDGFLKVFTKISMYNPDKSFRAWMRRIMINTAVDHYRKESKHQLNRYDVSDYDQPSNQENAIDKMAFDEVIQEIQQLSPSYRTVFNLYVMDGFKHEEIGEMLGISVGTSKSNLSRARAQLQKALRKKYKDELA